jgi:hypothetical protein
LGLHNDEEAAMRYRVYSGPHGSGDFRAIEKDRMLFKEFSSLDEAMRWAKHLDTTGHTALLIEGDDGSQAIRCEGLRRATARDRGGYFVSAFHRARRESTVSRVTSASWSQFTSGFTVGAAVVVSCT